MLPRIALIVTLRKRLGGDDVEREAETHVRWPIVPREGEYVEALFPGVGKTVVGIVDTVKYVQSVTNVQEIECIEVRLKDIKL